MKTETIEKVKCLKCKNLFDLIDDKVMNSGLNDGLYICESCASY